jgi:esterase/lipase
METERRYELNTSTYEWSARVLDSVRQVLKVNITMHQDQRQVRRGEIFLFNHFARFETFIPQYLFFRDAGALCRSVAARELFRDNQRLARLLARLGVVPNDHPRLLPFLATEILKGRKVVIFPEGGMVKDRRVIDDSGEYNVFSRHAGTRRKHHSGAAVLATGLEAFRRQMRAAESRGDWAAFDRWAAALGFEDPADLHAAVHRPTTVVPANITFYPLRVSDNRLSQTIARLAGGVSPRAAEELIIESNILTKDTDMDVRLGVPLLPRQDWRAWRRPRVRGPSDLARAFDGLFSPDSGGDRWVHRAYSFGVRSPINRLRDRYMEAIYKATTVNVSHLASQILVRLRDRPVESIDLDEFHRAVYLGIKRLQDAPDVHRHRSVVNPECYADLVDGRCAAVEQFIASMGEAGLVARRGARLHLLDKSADSHEFDHIRIENPMAVYANESQPVPAVKAAVTAALDGVTSLTPAALARLRADDELRSLRWDRAEFSKPRHAALNAQETATESADPELLLPANPRRLGVLLVHGLLASPAEVRGFGHKLGQRGHCVFMPRLKGHGTSPWDLQTREWTEWLASAQRGYDIIAPLVERVCVVGFSTGGTLALLLGADPAPKLAGVVSISSPVRFTNRKMVFVPLVHGTNVLVRSVSPTDGVMPFQINESEHPHVNYRHVPIQALYQVTRAVDAMMEALPRIRCPVQIIHGTDDHIADPVSAQMIYDELECAERDVAMIPSPRHGILNEDVGRTHAVIEAFLERVGSMTLAAASRASERC